MSANIKRRLGILEKQLAMHDAGLRRADLVAMPGRMAQVEQHLLQLEKRGAL